MGTQGTSVIPNQLHLRGPGKKSTRCGEKCIRTTCLHCRILRLGMRFVTPTRRSWYQAVPVMLLLSFIFGLYLRGCKFRQPANTPPLNAARFMQAGRMTYCQYRSSNSIVPTPHIRVGRQRNRHTRRIRTACMQPRRFTDLNGDWLNCDYGGPFADSKRGSYRYCNGSARCGGSLSYACSSYVGLGTGYVRLYVSSDLSGAGSSGILLLHKSCYMKIETDSAYRSTKLPFYSATTFSSQCQSSQLF